MRELVAVPAAAAALCLVAVACTTTQAGPNGTPSPSASSSTPTASGPVTLRFAVYGDQSRVASYTDLAEAFTRSNPGVRVLVEHAASAGAATDELERDVANGEPPDVFLSEADLLPGLVAEGRVQPLDVLLEDREVDFGDGYERDGLEAFSAESALQCMPYDVSPLVVYYNEDMLDPRSLVEDEGDEPPTAREGWSWEQFSTAARRLSRGRTNGVYIEPELETLAPFIWSAGGDLVDDLESPTSLSMSSGDTQAAMEVVLTLVRDPEVTPTQQQVSRRGAVTLFKRGRLGMILGTRALIPELRAAPDLRFEVFPLPSLGGYRTISSITGYCVSTDTEHVEAAADFVAFAVGRQGATISTLSGYVVPSNVEVLNSPVFTQPDEQPANAFVFREGVRRAEDTPFVAEWPLVVRESRPLLRRMFNAPVIDLEALLEQMDARSQTILAPEVEPEEQ